jgi:hypothetical protein
LAPGRDIRPRWAAGPTARHDHSQAPRDLLTPLFDPQLVRMTNTQMTLHGYQIHAEAGNGVHYAQGWVLRQVKIPNS